MDLDACPWPKPSDDTAGESYIFNDSACTESQSIYLDPNIAVNYTFPGAGYPYDRCMGTWFV